MINLNELGSYTENNRIEAKTALGGLPESIWETYSAFANTLGGIILLGVMELPNRKFCAVDLPDPHRLMREFNSKLDDRRIVSANILSDRDVRVERADGKSIVVIQVPPARLCDLPVYIGGDPYKGSYKRNGDGDYRMTPFEVAQMVRRSARREVSPLSDRSIMAAKLINYLTDSITLTPVRAAEVLHTDLGTASFLLDRLADNSVLVRESGADGNIYYRLTE